MEIRRAIFFQRTRKENAKESSNFPQWIFRARRTTRLSTSLFFAPRAHSSDQEQGSIEPAEFLLAPTTWCTPLLDEHVHDSGDLRLVISSTSSIVGTSSGDSRIRRGISHLPTGAVPANAKNHPDDVNLGTEPQVTSTFVSFDRRIFFQV